VVLVPCYGTNDAVFGSASACEGRFDLAQIESGRITHEWILTSKVGTVHSVPSATVVSGGRLSLHFVMRPKGSIGGTNPWTTAVYLWRQDASNLCSIGTDGIITSKVAGVDAVSTTPVAFARGDRLEWSYSGGGDTLPTVIKLRKNGGAIQTITLAVQGTVPNTGVIGMGCDPASPAANSLEGWYELKEFYRSGTGPTWAA
jgi:hypothetical protein